MRKANILTLNPTLILYVAVPVISASAITVLTAFSAFHLHVPPAALSTSVAVASIIIGYFTHQSVTPVPAVQRGTTAEKLQLETAVSGTL